LLFGDLTVKNYRLSFGVGLGWQVARDHVSEVS